MKVLGIVGSPRVEGTTYSIVQNVLAGAAKAGAETKLVLLNELEFKGCQGCRKCKQGYDCAQNDDMTGIYPELFEADILVLGSPVYMAYVTGQTKLFLDRLYAFTGPDQVSRLPKGKTCLLVLTQGYSDIEGYQTMAMSLSSLLERLGYAVTHPLIIGGVYNADDELAKLGAQRAYELGFGFVEKN